MSKSGHLEVDGGKDRVKHNGKKPKLTFAELLAKYKKIMGPNVLISQMLLNIQYCLLDIIMGIGIDKERVFIQRQYILLLSHQCQFHMFHIPLVLILIHRGGGVINRHILLHILDHIMLSMQLQDDYRMQGSHMLKVTILSIKIGMMLKTRKRWSSKFTE
jgi:hypothetical protein